MNKIQLLAPLVAERIAAGEVIERPASVIKELVENAIDAGAKNVAIRVEDGGKSLIEVIDDGEGMGPEDLLLAPLRHATSKIREVADLETLSTLGFRGEALPSIAACADLTILSRQKGKDDAFQWKAGKTSPTTFGTFNGSQHGTRIQVRSLFSQIPARLKFLKSSASEIALIREWIERIALTHPEVGFKLETEARTLLHYRPESESERVLRVLGDEGDYPIVSEEVVEAGALRARIHWLQGATSPQMKKMAQIVNGRAVRDRLLNQALLTAFRQAVLPGQFPWLALFLEVPSSLLDVNVHPTKTELRFLNASQIFRLVEKLAEHILQKNGIFGFSPNTSHSNTYATPFQSGENKFLNIPTSELRPSTMPLPFERVATGAPHALDPSPTPPLLDFSGPSATHSDTQLSPSASSPRLSTSSFPFTLTRDRYAGSLFQTYLMYDLGSELLLVDQHAAHERIRYEQLKRRVLRSQADTSSQALLVPEVVKYPLEHHERLQDRLSLLESMGFEAEFFGTNDFSGQLLFRSIPTEWGTDQLRIRLLTLVEKLISLEIETLTREESTHYFKWDEKLFEKLASEACHSAVRAGDRLTPEVAQSLVEQLTQCEHPWNCPHGRPTLTRVPRTRFEEWFQRRV